METDNKKQFNNCDTGAGFWRDTLISHGFDEALIICSNYLDMNLKREHSDDEKNFSRDLFVAMYQATANKADPVKIIYPYSFEKAGERLETSYYTMSRRVNQECSRAITEAINDSCYTRNYYNLENAAWKVLLKYGFNRVNAVLAHQIQAHEYDGRYSQANKKWAKGFNLTDEVFAGTFMNAHATLLDSFANYTRKLYTDMDAIRYALPGNVECGEFVHGYEITRAVMVDDNKGYAIGYNPDAANPYVCWRFKIESQQPRDYFWGFYVNHAQAAADNYSARVYVHLTEINSERKPGNG